MPSIFQFFLRYLVEQACSYSWNRHLHWKIKAIAYVEGVLRVTRKYAESRMVWVDKDGQHLEENHGKSIFLPLPTRSVSKSYYMYIWIYISYNNIYTSLTCLAVWLLTNSGRDRSVFLQFVSYLHLVANVWYIMLCKHTCPLYYCRRISPDLRQAVLDTENPPKPELNSAESFCRLRLPIDHSPVPCSFRSRSQSQNGWYQFQDVPKNTIAQERKMPLSELPYMKKVLHSVEAFDVKSCEINWNLLRSFFPPIFWYLDVLSLFLFSRFAWLHGFEWTSIYIYIPEEKKGDPSFAGCSHIMHVCVFWCQFVLAFLIRATGRWVSMCTRRAHDEAEASLNVDFIGADMGDTWYWMILILKHHAFVRFRITSCGVCTVIEYFGDILSLCWK